MAIQQSQLQQIATGLAGFGAGIGGQLPQFMQQQQNAQMQNQQMDMQKQQFDQQQQAYQMDMREKLTQSMIQDAKTALAFAKRGQFGKAAELGLGRLKMGQNFPGVDFSDTQRMTRLAIGATKGGPEGEEAAANLIADLELSLDAFRDAGLIETPKENLTTVAKDSIVIDSAGNTVASNIQPEAADPGYELIPNSEAAALGLPPNASYQRNKKNGQISGIGGAQTVVNVGQATEGERRAGMLANRLDFAQSQINDVLSKSPEAQSPNALPTALQSIGFDYLARVANPSERRIIEAAQRDMLDAALTLGTGAAYTKEQIDGYRDSFFPQLNEDQATIDAKAARLQNLLESAYKQAGRGAPEAMRSAEPPAGQAGGLSPSEQAELQELRSRYGR